MALNALVESFWPHDNLPPNGHGQGYVIRFIKFWPPIASLESVKIGTANAMY